MRSCASACWIAAGYDGGSVPKWARKSLGVLALAGTERIALVRQGVPAQTLAALAADLGLARDIDAIFVGIMNDPRHRRAASALRRSVSPSFS